jgi:pimeloyl-ACP methyl ester carboxylesterase
MMMKKKSRGFTRIPLLSLCLAAAFAACTAEAKYTVWEEAYITTDDGCKIRYMESGAGKKTVLYVHGYLDGGESFKYVARNMTGRYRIITYDLRAHGASDTTADGYTMERYAQDLKNLIDQLKLRNINIIGYSMGMQVIWDYIRQFGDGAFDKIINTAMPPRVLNDPAAPRYNYGIAGFDGTEALARIADYNARFRQLMTSREESLRPMFDEYPPWREYAGRSVNYDAGAMTRLLIEIYAADYRDLLPAITRPVLMITAQHDIYPLEGFEDQAKRLKAPSTVVVIEGGPEEANHSFPLNLPDKYAAALEEFIQRNK